MKAVFNNEEFNLTFSIDLTASTEVLEAKLDVLEKVIIFWGGNGCLGFEKVKVSEL